MMSVRVSFSGNFVDLRFEAATDYRFALAQAELLCSYDVRKFNPKARCFETVRIRRYWGYPDTLKLRTFRGLLPRLIKKLPYYFYRRPFADVAVYDYPDFLRLYQREVLAKAIDQLELCGAATCQMATGSGKSVLAVGLIKAIRPVKTFYLSLNSDLLYQFKGFCERYGLRAGIVNAENFQVEEPVTCVTIQTLYRALREVERLEERYEGNDELDEEVKVLLEETEVKDKYVLAKLYKSADLVILDEVQHVPARTVWYCSIANSEALRLGLSATPWREAKGLLTLSPLYEGREGPRRGLARQGVAGHGVARPSTAWRGSARRGEVWPRPPTHLDIYACCGDPVPRKVTSSELIDHGYLVPCHIVFLHYRDPSYRWLPRDWMAVKRYVMESGDRAEFVANVALRVPRPFMCLVREIKQGELIVEAMRRRGLRVRYLTGKVDPEERARVFELVRQAGVDGIVCTQLADEMGGFKFHPRHGLDLPALRSLILAGGGKSSTRALQRVGRIVRPWEGKEVGVVVDIVDEVRYFRDHAQKREAIYRTEPKWRIRHLYAGEFLEEGWSVAG